MDVYGVVDVEIRQVKKIFTQVISEQLLKYKLLQVLNMFKFICPFIF